MTTPLEHDYIGLTETSPMERSSEKISSSSSSSSPLSITTIEDKTTKDSSLMNLKETELRLGLPGSQSPERKPSLFFGKDSETNDKKSKGFCGGSPLKNFVSGAKRGFSDAIDGSNGKWGFGKSDAEMVKGSVLASPNINNSQQARTSSVSVKKEVVVGVPQSPKPVQDKKNHVPPTNEHASDAPAAKAQVVGWPPIRSFRKNSMVSNLTKNGDEGSGCCLYVKVSMDGAPYLRKVDLNTYNNYLEFSSALEKMFRCFTIGKCSSNGIPARDGLSESRLMDLLHGSEYVLTYEDKDGDWMLVGDVPWGMFTGSCRRLRIMKGSEAIGLAPRVMEKCKNQN